jgi:hypothetical protein
MWLHPWIHGRGRHRIEPCLIHRVIVLSILVEIPSHVIINLSCPHHVSPMYRLLMHHILIKQRWLLMRTCSLWVLLLLHLSPIEIIHSIC